MARAWVALGSNIEPRREHLRGAVAALKRPPFRLLGLSRLYESEPMDVPGQPWFLNMVAEVDCALEAPELLKALQAVEAAAGKKVLVRRGPRTLDLDLLLYEDRVIETPELSVPHPKMLEREFVLRPLCDIGPSLRHPLAGKSAAELLADLPQPGPQVRDLGALEGA